jgi:hypothetical protein
MSTSISLKKALEKIRGTRSRRRSSLSSIETPNMASSGQPQPNVMHFLIDVCPEDVLPKILAFAGPQKTAALSQVNRVWRDIVAEDGTWRVLCEDLYKVCSHLYCLLHEIVGAPISESQNEKTPRYFVAGLQNGLVLLYSRSSHQLSPYHF